MAKLTADALRTMYLEFFASKGHAIISGASVIPENDPTVLFTTAGLHPLGPHLLGAPPPPVPPPPRPVAARPDGQTGHPPPPTRRIRQG